MNSDLYRDMCNAYLKFLINLGEVLHLGKIVNKLASKLN